ncbi:MAG: hypothetical protein KIC89_21715 [Acetobacteraceae bacterium]|nr:hypothetical protein [Acetobacteraceae bacterium]
MPTAKKRSRERRWIVLSTDGRYVTLGRATDLSEDEVRGAEEALRAQGLAGWLAVMEGNPYVGAEPRLMEVRPLADPVVSFAEAATACARAIAARYVELVG